MTLRQLAQALRELYPDATSVTLFVNAQEHSAEATYRNPDAPEHTGSYRCLNGEWAPRKRTAEKALGVA